MLCSGLLASHSLIQCNQHHLSDDYCTLVEEAAVAVGDAAHEPMPTLLVEHVAKMRRSGRKKRANVGDRSTADPRIWSNTSASAYPGVCFGECPER